MNNEDKILQMLTEMQGEQKKTNVQITEMKRDLANLKNSVDNIKGQLNENTQLVKAILHNQEYSNAELEALKTSTATAAALKEIKDGQLVIENKLAVLNNDFFTQRADIQGLKRIK